MKSRTVLLFLALLTCLTAGGSALFYFQYSAEVAERELRTKVTQAAQIIGGELDVAVQYHQRTVSAFSRLPRVRNFSGDSDTADVSAMSVLLQILCESIDGRLCYMLDTQGEVIAANGPDVSADFVGKNFAFRPYYTEAMKNGSAVYLAKGVATGKRGVYFAHKVLDAPGRSAGVVVIKLPPRFLGMSFSRFEGRAMLMAPDGIIFATNHVPWLLKTFQPLAPEDYGHLKNTRQFGDDLQGALNIQHDIASGRILAANEQFMSGKADVESLPGWQAQYLLHETPGQMSEADSWIAYIFSIMSLVMLAVVALLYWAGIRDRNSRHNAERALRESESRLRRLTELSSEAIIIHHDGVLMDANGAAEQLFGYERHELMTLDIWQLLVNDSREFARQQEQRDNDAAYEVEGRRNGGVTFPLEITAKHTVLAGQEVRVVCMRDISSRKEQEAHVRFQALYDGLTRLPNRHNLLQQLDNGIRQADCLNNPLHLMFIDLDDFKKINDSMGHAAGDRLLVMVASRMRQLVEQDEVLARYGGDEFLILLHNKPDSRVQALADKVLNTLRLPFALDGGTFYISGSVGIARYPEDASTGSELLRQADTAMYSSKDDGRNTWNFFNAGMNAQVSERITLEQNLRHALARNELYVEYQPVFFAGDEKVVAAEALLRWRSPELGFVGPDRFIPVAEETGMIEEIGCWVMEQACLQAKAWLDQGLQPFYISVNLSPRQFRDPKLIAFVTELLARIKLPASTLVFELTEGVLVKEDEATLRAIQGIADLGIGIAMDDFGTGYSSLSYLKRFPFDTLKIDREFVRDLETDPGDQKLIVATIAMAKALGLRVVAEGVENDAQKQFLKDAGVDYLQGYLLSRPISPDSFSSSFIPELPVSEAILAEPA